MWQQVLERAALHHAEHALDLIDSVDALLAGMACARAEVLWWFRHWGEVCCACMCYPRIPRRPLLCVPLGGLDVTSFVGRGRSEPARKLSACFAGGAAGALPGLALVRQAAAEPLC